MEPMETNQLLEAFIQVVREQDYVFSQEAISSIPQLLEQIEQLPNHTFDTVAEIARLWYIQYPDVRDAVLSQEREIDRVRRTPPANQEHMLENRSRVVREELEKLQTRYNEQTPPNQTNQTNNP
jgi:hypothetical protein